MYTQFFYEALKNFKYCVPRKKRRRTPLWLLFTAALYKLLSWIDVHV